MIGSLVELSSPVIMPVCLVLADLILKCRAPRFQARTSMCRLAPKTSRSFVNRRTLPIRNSSKDHNNKAYHGKVVYKPMYAEIHSEIEFCFGMTCEVPVNV